MDEATQLCLDNEYFALVHSGQPTFNGIILTLPDNFMLGVAGYRVAYIIDEEVKEIICRFSDDDFQTYEEDVISYEEDWQIRPIILVQIRKTLYALGIDSSITFPTNEEGVVVDIMEMLPTVEDEDKENDYFNELYLTFVGERDEL